MNFSPSDIQQIQDKGLTLEKVEEQLTMFDMQIPYVNLKAHATIGDGILRLEETEKEKFIALYKAEKERLDIVKFTPASGAATRMFKSLYRFLEIYEPKKSTINSYINNEKAQDVRTFLIGSDKLPFYDNIIALVNEESNHKELSSDEFYYLFVKSMLDENGLHLGNFPKGLMPFHKYKNHLATPFQEHLFEAASYACNREKSVLHFTITEHHLEKFKNKEKEILNIIEEKTNCKFSISYSFQSPATDTIAVDLKNNPLRDQKGKLVFRPGGHGALIQNLNMMNADIIFIKNVDNVVVHKYANEIANNKKILAGKLIDLQKKIFAFLEKLHQPISDDDIVTILNFLHNELNVQISEEFEKYSRNYQIAYLKEKLNRPLRVCGMVKNEGEPGGGPFWVKHENGSVSLQIVESAQIDKKNDYHQQIFKQSTHFNPVDIVCGIKNYKGEKFDLTKFVDKKAYFIASKSKSGKKLKALELPGLWNGGMAFWNTVFIEVPLITFNPVKTVNDLLKPPHQVN